MTVLSFFCFCNKMNVYTYIIVHFQVESKSGFVRCFVKFISSCFYKV